MTQQDSNSSGPRLDADQQSKSNLPFSSLGRQSSIYSLTLDEFQHTLCESGKSFGSMNMDEFLASIWTAEGNQAMNDSNTAINANANTNTNTNTNSSSSVQGPGQGYNKHVGVSEHIASSGGGNSKSGIAKQPSLPRQVSLTLPSPLCRKTVDEVWSEINKTQQAQQRQGDRGNSSNTQKAETATCEPTFGEMTLEDFLVKAGVVRQPCFAIPTAPPPQQQQPPYGSYQNSTPGVGPNFIPRQVVVVRGGGGVTAYQHPSVGGDTSGFPVSKRSGNAGYGAVGYGAAVGNGGGYVSMGGPVSPVSSDGHQGDNNSGGLYGMEVGGMRREKKRIIDVPMDKVVERRQRRMIKNRESAARSRARKQVELEHKRKQQYFVDRLRLQAQTRASKAKEKLRIRKRSSSWPL